MKFFRQAFSLLLLASLTAACAVGPDYTEPEWELSDSFSQSTSGPFRKDEIDAQWWTTFHDPMLNSLIVQAAEKNKDVLAALTRIKRSRALRRNSWSELFPGARAVGSYLEGENSGAQFPSSDGSGAGGFEFEVYSASLDVLWEIDIFGRLRRELEARDAELVAANADSADVVRIVRAEIATSYLDLRRAQAQLAIAKENASVQKESLRVAEAKYEFGLRGELDQAQARAQLENTLATVPPLEAEVRIAIHRISVLLGQQPHALSADLLTPQKIPTYNGPVQITAPSSLLRNRPDIRVAERKLAAETARVGVAVAELFPKLEFGGSLGVEAREFSQLTDGQGIYSWGPTISWSPLDFGRLRSLIRAQEATAMETLLSYEKSVLTALEEAENSLARYSSEQARLLRLQSALRSSKRAYEISNEQYREGVIDFLSVLTSQETMLRDQTEVVSSKTQLAKNLVGIYKAFGGGWSSVESEDNQEAAASPSEK